MKVPCLTMRGDWPLQERAIFMLYHECGIPIPRGRVAALHQTGVDICTARELLNSVVIPLLPHIENEV